MADLQTDSNLDPYIIEYLVHNGDLNVNNELTDLLESIYYLNLAHWLITLNVYEVADYLSSSPYFLYLRQFKQIKSSKQYAMELLNILGEEYHSNFNNRHNFKFTSSFIAYLKANLSPIEYTVFMTKYHKAETQQSLIHSQHQ